MLDLNYVPRAIYDTSTMSNPEWLKARTSGIGGSDVAAIYEVSGWTTRRALYYAKMGLSKNEADNEYTLDFGHIVEPLLYNWFQKVFEKKYKVWLENQLKCEIEHLLVYTDPMMYEHPLYPFMHADLDGRVRIITKDGEVKDGVFECKTTSYHIGEEKWNDGKVPYEYELQTRHYMSVMNVDFTIIACTWGNNENDYRVRLVKRDLDMEEELIEMESDFWYNNVLAHNPPPLSQEHAAQEMDAFNHYSIADRIKDGTLKELGNDDEALRTSVKSFLDASEKINALKEQLSHLEDEVTKNKCQILECLADKMDGKAHEFKLDDGDDKIIIKNKKTITTRIDSDRLKFELPDIAAKYSKTSESTRFSVKRLAAN